MKQTFVIRCPVKLLCFSTYSYTTLSQICDFSTLQFHFCVLSQSHWSDLGVKIDLRKSLISKATLLRHKGRYVTISARAKMPGTRTLDTCTWNVQARNLAILILKVEFVYVVLRLNIRRAQLSGSHSPRSLPIFTRRPRVVGSMSPPCESGGCG